MLEIRKYTSAEMANELGIALTVNSLKSCIKGKLDRLGVEYDYDGRGASTIYEIKSLPDEFKDYCMKHFGCASNTDFQKMREVFFLALNDESYLSKPDTEKQDMSDEYGIHTYRGTIAKYISKLENAGYIGGGEYRYLVVTKDTEGIHHSKEVSKERYCNGWKIYWSVRAETKGDYILAYDEICRFLGGHPLKRLVPQQNAFMLDEIEELQRIIRESYENDLRSE